ncbi:12941_t:CDS:2 [Entrophospora sp. SA101]|nr:15229_t:CDS:2 [Entrophospora sp. SA101]CAJ0747037.1 12941_t:CDS:2 [Entrophospora sp. SA101]CAJ0897700.1 4229_t:CDS:2 [Entrophospora sp. SA101]
MFPKDIKVILNVQTDSRDKLDKILVLLREFKPVYYVSHLYEQKTNEEKTIYILTKKLTMKKNKIEKIIQSVQETPLFRQAFTHSSFINENKEEKIADYETLEFLGDSILDMYVCLYIYRNYPHYSEGEMSKLKQFMVQQKTLAELSQETKLFQFLKLGAGEEKSKGKEKTNILADIFESFVAALYLEKGAKIVERNQAESQEFIVEVRDSLGKIRAQGQGKSKKSAEQEAARQALEKIGNLKS